MRLAHPFPTLPRLRVCQRQVPPPPPAASCLPSRIPDAPPKSKSSCSVLASIPGATLSAPLTLLPISTPPLSLQQSGVRGFPPRGRRVIDESTHAPAPERLGQELFTPAPALAPNRASPQLLPKAARPHTDTRTPSRRLPAPGAQRSPDLRVPVT